MPGNRKPDERDQNDDDLERLAYEAMQSLGWLIPQTAEDVARAEKALADEPIALPEGLKNPYAILDTPPKERTSLPCSAGENDAAEQLARVAREGGTIAPKVEERMRQDREQAEREQ